MNLQLLKPFGSYVTLRELPRNGDARAFLLTLPFTIENEDRTDLISWPWEYTGTQAALDRKDGGGAFQQRLAREIELFRRHLVYELNASQQRIYEDLDSGTLLRGPLTRRAFNDGARGTSAA
jgi:hypothetical protein